MKISVIVPVYNDENYFEKCLKSIYNQTLNDIEVIIVDDGSNDRSLEIAESFKSLNNIPTTIIKQKNMGAGCARNRGLDVATGDFIKFVDADDFLYMDTLEVMYDLAIKEDADMVRGNLTLIQDGKMIADNTTWWPFDYDNIILNPKKEKDFITIEIPSVGNKLFKRNIFNDLRFPENLKWEDLAIIPVILGMVNKVGYLNQSVYNYRLDDNTTSDDFNKSTSRILDIISIVELMENNMESKDLTSVFKNQIEGLYILHTLFRVENVMSWTDFSLESKKIVINALINFVELRYPNWQDNKYIEMYRRVNNVFNENMSKVDEYLDIEFRGNGSLETIRENVSKLF